jgi:hypothetical protein
MLDPAATSRQSRCKRRSERAGSAAQPAAPHVSTGAGATEFNTKSDFVFAERDPALGEHECA